jgi:hypothetical protein
VLLHQQGARVEIFRRSSGQGWSSEECAEGSMDLPGGLRVDLDAL